MLTKYKLSIIKKKKTNIYNNKDPFRLYSISKEIYGYNNISM